MQLSTLESTNNNDISSKLIGHSNSSKSKRMRREG